MAGDTDRIDFPAASVLLIRDGAALWVLVRPGTDGRGRWHAVFVLAANGVYQPGELPAPRREHEQAD
jgi:hypothetical protein